MTTSGAEAGTSEVIDNPSSSPDPCPPSGFDGLGLSPEILKAVADSGYTTPTPIQAQGIPDVLQRRDLIGIAQTGTGKTASFTLPMIEMLSAAAAPRRACRAPWCWSPPANWPTRWRKASTATANIPSSAMRF